MMGERLGNSGEQQETVDAARNERMGEDTLTAVNLSEQVNQKVEKPLANSRDVVASALDEWYGGEPQKKVSYDAAEKAKKREGMWVKGLALVALVGVVGVGGVVVGKKLAANEDGRPKTDMVGGGNLGRNGEEGEALTTFTADVMGEAQEFSFERHEGGFNSEQDPKLEVLNDDDPRNDFNMYKSHVDEYKSRESLLTTFDQYTDAIKNSPAICVNKAVRTGVDINALNLVDKDGNPVTIDMENLNMAELNRVKDIVAENMDSENQDTLINATLANLAEELDGGSIDAEFPNGNAIHRTDWTRPEGQDMGWNDLRDKTDETPIMTMRRADGERVNDDDIALKLYDLPAGTTIEHNDDKRVCDQAYITVNANGQTYKLKIVDYNGSDEVVEEVTVNQPQNPNPSNPGNPNGGTPGGGTPEGGTPEGDTPVDDAKDPAAIQQNMQTTGTEHVTQAGAGEVTSAPQQQGEMTYTAPVDVNAGQAAPGQEQTQTQNNQDQSGDGSGQTIQEITQNADQSHAGDQNAVKQETGNPAGQAAADAAGSVDVHAGESVVAAQASEAAALDAIINGGGN